MSRYGDVVHVGVALDNRELIVALQRRSTLLSRVQDAGAVLLRDLAAARTSNDASSRNGTHGTRVVLQQRMGGLRSSVGGASATGIQHGGKTQPARRKKERQLDRSVRALRDFDRNGQLKTLLRQRHQCTGTAFVTFNASQAARKCIRDGASLLFDGDQLVVQQAPAPDQVLWENLQVSKRVRVLRQVASTLLLLVASFLGASIISFTAYLKPEVQKAIVGERCNASLAILAAANATDECGRQLAPIDCDLTLWESIPVLISSTVLIILGHIIIFILAPVLAVLLERPHFFYQREV